MRVCAGCMAPGFRTTSHKGVNGPVYGFLLDHFQMQDIITVAPDRQTAKGRFRGLLMGGSHESRAYHPEGLPLQFYEAGIYENDYVREEGVWKIKRLDYMMQWQADYERGFQLTALAIWHHGMLGQTLLNAVTCRGLFWDGASFLASGDLQMRS